MPEPMMAMRTVDPRRCGAVRGVRSPLPGWMEPHAGRRPPWRAGRRTTGSPGTTRVPVDGSASRSHLEDHVTDGDSTNEPNQGWPGPPAPGPSDGPEDGPAATQ